MMAGYPLTEGRTREVIKRSSSTLKPIAPPPCGDPEIERTEGAKEEHGHGGYYLATLERKVLSY